MPTLVTGGRHDEMRPEHMAVLADGIPNAELIIFEESSHMAFVEEREAYVDTVRQFLNKVDGGPAAKRVGRPT
jgi:pimeloyl-ACP methyl ester carboxylesterase